MSPTNYYICPFPFTRRKKKFSARQVTMKTGSYPSIIALIHNSLIAGGYWTRGSRKFHSRSRQGKDIWRGDDGDNSRLLWRNIFQLIEREGERNYRVMVKSRVECSRVTSRKNKKYNFTSRKSILFVLFT